MARTKVDEQPVRIATDGLMLEGDLAVPPAARGLILFAHGSGSSRFSPRNRYVAGDLREAGMGTLLLDLLTPEEEQADRITAHLRFDIGLLADRLVRATDWVAARPEVAALNLGVFGASTGAAAALIAAADRPEQIRAVVSRGGRPDLAGSALTSVRVPTLLIVGGEDAVVLDLNRQVLARIPGRTELEIVIGAGHLFEEPGALDEVVDLTKRWFLRYLAEPA